MYEMKLYYANVVDNDDQNHDDGKKLSRIKIRALPEMQGIEEDKLPWVRPFFQAGMSASHFSHTVPENNSKIWVIFIDDYFKNGYYLNGAFIDGFFDFDTVETDLGNISESIDLTYPNLKFYYLPDGTIIFYNSDTGDKGIYHSNGSYGISTADGQRYIYAKDQEIKIYNDEVEFTLSDDGTYKIDGAGTIECKSSGQIDINGNLTVDT